MNRMLSTLALFVSLTAPAVAAPVVTLGPPVTDAFSTVDPGSIRVDMLGAGEFVDLQLSITIDPFCIRPYEIELITAGDGGTFANQTGNLINDCGGNTSAFDIRLTGDGLAHAFDIEFVDVDTGVPIISISVTLYPGAAPVVTLGPPVTVDSFTYDPGSIRVEMLGAGHSVDLQVSMTVHPVCFMPINPGVTAFDDGGTFTDLTGPLVNNCDGETSEFSIRLTGDGLAHGFDLLLFDTVAFVVFAAIPVELFPGLADTDGDGVTDLSDNCLDVSNADQRDTDTDSIGNACDPDIASPNDCRVNFADLNTLKQAFFSTPDVGLWNPDADFDGDGQVNFADLETMKSAFFGRPGPSAAGCN